MKAKLQVVSGKLTPNGRESIWRVRGGEKGTGQQYGPEIIMWPWSQSSHENAEKVVWEICKRYDLELVYEEEL